jgi:hypothetical protein
LVFCAFVSGTYDLHVSFDVAVGTEPAFIPHQNAGALASNQHPQTAHVSQPRKHAKDVRDVVGIGRRQIVVSLANEFFAPVSDELAEIVRGLDELPVAIDDRDILGSHARKWRRSHLQLVANRLNDAPRSLRVFWFAIGPSNARRVSWLWLHDDSYLGSLSVNPEFLKNELPDRFRIRALLRVNEGFLASPIRSGAVFLPKTSSLLFLL